PPPLPSFPTRRSSDLYKLVMTAIAQVQQWNPKVAKDGHQVARTLLNIKSELHKEATPGIPPDLMLGMGMGGAPGPMSPQPSASGDRKSVVWERRDISG